MLNSWDNLFYSGLNNIEEEINIDLIQVLIQPEKSLFYFRQEGAGVKENIPNTFSQQMLTRYKIAKWVAFRNGYLQGEIEKRVAISQNYIEIENNSNEQNISVYYIPYSKLQDPAMSVVGV